jgi:pyruvate formate lyase activating enzyme
MGCCVICGHTEKTISTALGLCRSCILAGDEQAVARARSVHEASRREFGLPLHPPDDEEGILCPLCTNACRPAAGGKGYCAVRWNRHGRWAGALPDAVHVSWYHDALPTNCVAAWVCPAATDSGYPRFTDTRGPERGCDNLAVFYEACSFNCLFCQNWHFREGPRGTRRQTPSDLAETVRETTRCICYFGGDPAPHLPHALRASIQALRRAHRRILRICWETNGSMSPGFLKPMARLALESGGCIKFDLKAWDDRLHRALTGVSNQQTLRNFETLWNLSRHRPDPPPLVASTLLVPGYITPGEVRQVARFIASLNPAIPYALLAFHPQFFMRDLPATSRDLALEAFDAAMEAGLERVRVGNIHLLV